MNRPLTKKYCNTPRFLVAGDRDQRAFRLDREQLLAHFLSIDIGDALPQSGFGQVQYLRFIVIERDGDRRIHQRYPFEFVEDIPELRLVRLQELAPRRYVIEQVLHREVTPLRTRVRLNGLQLRAGYL